MADFVINSINTPGTTARSTNDSITASAAFANIPAFRAAVSNPQNRDEFLKILDSRKKMAEVSGNKQMNDFIGSLLNIAKSASSSSAYSEEKTDGHSFYSLG